MCVNYSIRERAEGIHDERSNCDVCRCEQCVKKRKERSANTDAAQPMDS